MQPAYKPASFHHVIQPSIQSISQRALQLPYKDLACQTLIAANPSQANVMRHPTFSLSYSSYLLRFHGTTVRWQFSGQCCLHSIPSNKHTLSYLRASKFQSLFSLFSLHCMRCEPFVITYLMWLPCQHVRSSACAGRGDGLIRTSVAPLLLITQQRLSRCVLASPTITIRGIYVLEMEK